jgi:monofunctional biosynthetic peptidoglycan transglycosylase
VAVQRQPTLAGPVPTQYQSCETPHSAATGWAGTLLAAELASAPDQVRPILLGSVVLEAAKAIAERRDHVTPKRWLVGRGGQGRCAVPLTSRRHSRRCNVQMKTILATLLMLGILPLSATASSPESAMRTLMNFDSSPQEPRWVAVNDGVMGGRSSGGPVMAENHMDFSGDLSLANNGGFSSVRTVGRDFDLSDATEVVLRVRGDGRSYQLRLATDARYRGMSVSYGAEFKTTAGEWIEVRLPLASLLPAVRGYALQGPPMDAANVREIGLLIGDKREGAFALSVDWIAVQ